MKYVVYMDGDGVPTTKEKAVFIEVVDDDQTYIRFVGDERKYQKYEEMRNTSKFMGYSFYDVLAKTIYDDAEYFDVLSYFMKGEHRVLVTRRDGVKQHYWVADEDFAEFKQRVEERGGRVESEEGVGGSSGGSGKDTPKPKGKLKVEKFQRFYKIGNKCVGEFRLKTDEWDMTEEEMLLDSRMNFKQEVYKFTPKGKNRIKHTITISKTVDMERYFDLAHFQDLVEKVTEKFPMPMVIHVDLDSGEMERVYECRNVFGRAYIHTNLVVMYSMTSFLKEFIEGGDLRYMTESDILKNYLGKGLRMKVYGSKIWNCQTEVLVHELGHQVLSKLPSEIQNKFVWTMYFYGKARYPTSYSKTNPHEYFAESFMCFCLFDDAKFKSLVGSDMFEFFKKYIEPYRIKFAGTYDAVMNVDPSGKKTEVFYGKKKLLEELKRKAIEIKAEQQKKILEMFR